MVFPMANPAAPLSGLLHVYDTEKRLVCFESGKIAAANTSQDGDTPQRPTARNSLIFVGGLSEGLAAVPILPGLSDALSDLDDWSLIQPLTRSSYGGWATSDIDRDVKDLISLEHYLRQQANRTGKLVLLGHSTGCQDIVRLFQLHGQTTTYDGVILQAPVSDREAAEHDMPSDVLSKTIQAAKEQSKAGGGAFPLPWHILKTMRDDEDDTDPISANRWLSLVQKGGKEDFFSSDLDNAVFDKGFEGLRKSDKPALILISGADEHMPSHIDKNLLLRRMMEAIGDSSRAISGEIVEGATHSLDDESVRKSVISRILRFLKVVMQH